ncbi:AMP-binding protein [Streptomyces sp. TRM76323]|uniref:AMP-binding protein n=1 Tax=Streptomyces tamarix TaxID=3078565 RepID=A0ABU3QI16_9ACTN|nr:AMP-binding protein [Streptomyces tamarix]MDT9682379.1 AMP-binding protein [Streptomyces tamarix]
MTAAKDDVLARPAALVEHPEADVPIGRTGARASQAVSAAQPLDGCRRTAHALRAAGVRRGDKAVVMTQDAYELFAAVHGTVSPGAVPVLIEPHAEVRRRPKRIAPDAFVGKPLAHAARRLPGRGRGHVRTALVTGRSFPGRDRLLGQRLPVVPDGSGPGPHAPQPHAEGPAMNFFTSGSTGRPRGAEYHHATSPASSRPSPPSSGPGPKTNRRSPSTRGWPNHSGRTALRRGGRGGGTGEEEPCRSANASVCRGS